MRALVWNGKRDVRVENVPDPELESPTDVIIRVTSTGLCGSDLHLYEVLGPFLEAGDILGHEPMGVVEEVGSEVTHVSRGDRVVIPFNISCGSCFMCDRGYQSQCETTQNTDQDKGASLFGYTKLYGQVAGGQAEYLRVPQGHYGPVKVPEGPADDRFLFLSDVLPTAWQAVHYADVPNGGTVAIFGLGPIGQMASRIAHHLGHRVIAVDLVDERLQMARKWGVEVLDLRDHDDRIADAVRELTDGRGADSTIDAVGMEAHGTPALELIQQAAGLLPDRAAEKLFEEAGVDRMGALHASINAARRGGTVSISGVYGGMLDPMPLMTMFDRQLTFRMGQANVKRWMDELLPLVTDDADPLGVESFTTHRVPLEEAPAAYEMFQKKKDGAFKIVFTP